MFIVPPISSVLQSVPRAPRYILRQADLIQSCRRPSTCEEEDSPWCCSKVSQGKIRGNGFSEALMSGGCHAWALIMTTDFLQLHHSAVSFPS